MFDNEGFKMITGLHPADIRCCNHRLILVKIYAMLIFRNLLITLGVLTSQFIIMESYAQEDAAHRVKVTQAAREIMLRSGQCALITVDKNGQPQVRTMDPFEPGDDFVIWLGTNPSSRKVAQIRNNNRVTLYYTDGGNGYVSVYGTAELINDTQSKEKYWKQEWENFYPNKTDAYLLIKVIPERLEIISYTHGFHGNPLTWQPETVIIKKP